MPNINDSNRFQNVIAVFASLIEHHHPYTVSGVFTGGLMARTPASYVSSLTLDMRRMCESGVFTLP